MISQQVAICNRFDFWICWDQLAIRKLVLPDPESSLTLTGRIVLDSESTLAKWSSCCLTKIGVLMLPCWFMHLTVTLLWIRMSQCLRAGRKYQRVTFGSSRLMCSDLKLRVHVPTVTPHCSGEGGDPHKYLCLMKHSSLTYPFHEKTSPLQQFRVPTLFTEMTYVCWSSLGIIHRLMTHLWQHI